MVLRNALRLQNGDEIRVKESGDVLTVVSVNPVGKCCLILCDDGNEYHHRDIL